MSRRKAKAPVKAPTAPKEPGKALPSASVVLWEEKKAPEELRTLLDSQLRVVLALMGDLSHPVPAGLSPTDMIAVQERRANARVRLAHVVGLAFGHAVMGLRAGMLPSSAFDELVEPLMRAGKVAGIIPLS